MAFSGCFIFHFQLNFSFPIGKDGALWYNTLGDL